MSDCREVFFVKSKFRMFFFLEHAVKHVKQRAMLSEHILQYKKTNWQVSVDGISIKGNQIYFQKHN